MCAIIKKTHYAPLIKFYERQKNVGYERAGFSIFG